MEHPDFRNLALRSPSEEKVEVGIKDADLCHSRIARTSGLLSRESSPAFVAFSRREAPLFKQRVDVASLRVLRHHALGIVRSDSDVWWSASLGR